MDPFTARVLELLPEYGPWFLFVLAVLETCFVTGLVVPSGVATSVGTVLALEGTLELAPVLAAAAAGGAVGDSVGFWVGRATGARVLAGKGRWTRVFDERRDTLALLFGRHPLFSVTLARLVSFVRTLMPMAAGMSGLPYARFLAYDAVGLVGWAALYFAIGALAEESWDIATRLVGVGGAVAFAAVAALLWWTLLRRPRRRRGTTRGGALP